ncbi:imelysin family protein [Thiothrix nivea]|uniref:imelysin family protein n=1 Tax=Thiothrix nivea TaxID=1031 RepID=UPI000315E07F|nr:imelysin family protein [Thiothrix nivea]
MKRISQIVSAALLGGMLSVNPTLTQADTVSAKAVMENYVNLAAASFGDALATANVLQEKVDAFIANPTDATQQAAKDAWLAARKPYSQTEAFRFSNPNVDEWEGQVNAWPLDEGLIDYVKQAVYDHEEGNPFASANIIAGKDPINVELLKSLNEKGGSEANVGTGYHAIEFLLWGQDFNADPTDAGKRPATDYAKGDACTNGNCERRGEYLKAATDLLVADLQTMADDWADSKDNYRQAFLSLPENEALRRMLFGMGSLSLGELAGERMNVALLAHSQEDEHSCFSDNTHNDIAEGSICVSGSCFPRHCKRDG